MTAWDRILEARAFTTHPCHYSKKNTCLCAVSAVDPALVPISSCSIGPFSAHPCVPCASQTRTAATGAVVVAVVVGAAMVVAVPVPAIVALEGAALAVLAAVRIRTCAKHAMYCVGVHTLLAGAHLNGPHPKPQLAHT
jgi:hypothetical protein